MPLNLSGKGTASNFEIDTYAKEIFERLAEFDSPKDAAAVLTLVQWYLIKAAFPPEYRNEAKDAVQTSVDLIKSFIDEGWQ